MTTELAKTQAGDELEPVAEARRQIARAVAERDADYLRELRGRASAFELYNRRAGAHELANDSGEIKVRAERGLGQIDTEVAPHGGDRSSSGSPELDVPLADVHHDTRAAWRTLGRLTDQEFDDRVARLRADENAGISTAGLIHVAGIGVHGSSARHDWETPQDLFDELDAEFGFELDVCATRETAKCARYFTPADDGLAQEWRGTCWMNPPYGDAIEAWVAKAAESARNGATVVCLVPARVDTGWWWDHCRHGEVRFLRGRLQFGDGSSSAPFPSAVVVLGRPARVVWWER